MSPALKIGLGALLGGAILFAASGLLFLTLDLPPRIVFAPGFAFRRGLDWLGASVTNRVVILATFFFWCIAVALILGWRETRRRNAA
jgi:type VI protein secretion system component VasK